MRALTARPHRWLGCAVAVGLVLTGCTPGLKDGMSPSSRATAPASAPTAQRVAGAGVAYSLYTHCGIRELRYGGAWYAHDGGLLDDGNGNPPRGWGNPYQAGRLAIAGATATFTDAAGHRETFHRRPGTAPSIICS